MPELQLTRAPLDRRCYAIEGVGTLRLTGWTSRGAIADAGGRSWEIARRGVLHQVIEAADAAGGVVGLFEVRPLRRGGTLRWAEHELALRPDSRWRERYVLTEGDRELATIDGKGWGKRPVSLIVGEPAAIDPGLLLFAAFVVRVLAEDAGTAVAST